LLALSPPAMPTTVPTEFLTPWALLTIPDARKRRAARKVFQHAGFAVEVAETVDEALLLISVMTPAVIVFDPPVALPGAGNLLDRSRTVGVEAAGDSDVMGQQLAKHRDGNGGQLLRKA